MKWRGVRSDNEQTSAVSTRRLRYSWSKVVTQMWLDLQEIKAFWLQVRSTIDLARSCHSTSHHISPVSKTNPLIDAVY